MGRLNIPEIPDQLETIGRLHAHALATDPDRFVVAVRHGDAADSGRESIVGFASAIERGQLWFLSMLFVQPGEQARGLGRRLLDQVLPPGDGSQAVMMAVTDSAQPISNGLYGSLGIVPRMPLAHLVGRPWRPEALPPLPAGVMVEPLAPVSVLPPEVHSLDREVLGFDHPLDHRFAMETGRDAYLVRGGDDQLIGYGYASPVGHVGPIAVRDQALLAPVAAHLLQRIQPRGALAVWVPGSAGTTFGALVRAGLRIDGFPLLLCWSRTSTDFERYLPLSPGLL